MRIALTLMVKTLWCNRFRAVVVTQQKSHIQDLKLKVQLEIISAINLKVVISKPWDVVEKAPSYSTDSDAPTALTVSW